jgi:hypothetical protein
LYLQKNESFKELNKIDKNKLDFWFTSNWMWDWKLLDKNWEFTHNSNLVVDNQKSRRVEFKIITNSDNVIKDIINN